MWFMDGFSGGRERNSGRFLSGYQSTTPGSAYLSPARLESRGDLLDLGSYSAILSTRNDTGRNPSLQQVIAVPGFAIHGGFAPNMIIATSRWMSAHA